MRTSRKEKICDEITGKLDALKMDHKKFMEMFAVSQRDFNRIRDNKYLAISFDFLYQLNKKFDTYYAKTKGVRYKPFDKCRVEKLINKFIYPWKNE